MREIFVDILGCGWVTARSISTMGEYLAAGEAFDMSWTESLKIDRKFIPNAIVQRWGRFDKYTKIGLVAGVLAMRDAAERFDAAQKTALVCSTVTGTGDVDRRYFATAAMEQGLFASPNLFAYTLPNCMLGEIAISGKLTGGNLIVSQDTPDMLAGIYTAIDMLAGGLCTQVLAGYCNTAAGLSPDHGARAGAVFMVIRKSNDTSPVSYDGESLKYNQKKISDIVELVNSVSGLSGD